MITVKRKLNITRNSRGQKVLATKGGGDAAVPAGRIPRVSRLMALAIVFDQMVQDGKVEDISDLARLAHVSQPRMTQIMNLNLLAPDIQEALLFLPPVTKGREPVHEKGLRDVVAEIEWGRQRKLVAGLHCSISSA